MSKVLIDRNVLERAVYGLELAYETDTPTVRDICAVLSAPSGTPAMPVKAYYHEAVNAGIRTKSVGLEVRKEFADAPLVLESDALARIACLEGEIAKRDARIMGLESQYQRGVYGLNNEGDPIGGDPAGGYANDNARLRAELAAIKAQEPVGSIEIQGTGFLCAPFPAPAWAGGRQPAVGTNIYAAPVSEAKAQGVVMQTSNFEASNGEYRNPGYEGQFDGETVEQAEARRHWATTATELATARLNAAPVQQVVPDASTKMQWPEIVALVNEVLGCEAHKYPCERGSIGHEMTGINFNSLARIIDRVRYAAAPAAPAADAGIVDMYRHLQKVTPYRFKKIQDASITDGGDVMYFHKDRFDAALLADMAAHCAAKGVV